MQLEVQDRAATGRGARVQAQLSAALELFAEAGHAARRPVRAVLEPLGVPGFAEARFDGHVLHLQAGASAEPWFPGLLAREVAHVALTDEAHPSHDPALLQTGFAAAKERSRDVRFLGAVGLLNHHVRDAYAEDLAAFVDAESLGPFLEHLAAAALALDAGAAEAAVERGHAAGALRRRGAPVPAGLPGQGAAAILAGAFAALHPDPTLDELEAALERMVEALPLD